LNRKRTLNAPSLYSWCSVGVE